jgi:hypothetical protein
MEEYDHIKNRIRNLYSKKEHFDEMIKAQTV